MGLEYLPLSILLEKMALASTSTQLTLSMLADLPTH